MKSIQLSQHLKKKIPIVKFINQTNVNRKNSERNILKENKKKKRCERELFQIMKHVM
jgi:phage FluMu protein Com